MEMGGYAGNILHVNLTDGSLRRQPLDRQMLLESIGGAGVNVRLARELIPPGTDPLSPRSCVIFGTGPFNGTFIPGASQTMTVYKSPLNGSFVQSNGGGIFSHFLKSSGYDHLVISGRSHYPVYITIQDDNVSLRHASDIWGLDGFDTTDELRLRHSPCSIIPIGIAGERQSAISVTHIDKGGTIGSGGLAAVMGSKNLKAIVACMGSRAIGVAEPDRLKRLVGEILDKINGYHLRTDLMDGGSMAMTKNWMLPGVVARNSSEVIPYPPDADSMKAQFYELHVSARKKVACAACPMSDKDRIDLPGGDRIYDTAVFMEMAALTNSPALGFVAEGTAVERYSMAMQYYDEMNRLGLDRLYSFQGLADYVITLFEQGIINRSDTGGMQLDRGYETLLQLARQTARRDGFGSLLSDGPIKAVKHIGNRAPFVHNLVKGQFIAFDPRLSGFLPMHLGMLVHPGRTLGVSAAMGAPSYSPAWPLSEIMKQAERCGVPPRDIGRLFTSDSFNLGRLVKHGEDFFGLFNMLGQCHRLYISRFFSLGIVAALYSAVTGVNCSAGELKESSARMWKEWQGLNTAAGYTRSDDLAPTAWFKPLKGPSGDYKLYDYFFKKELTEKDVRSCLDEYYDERERE